MHTNLSAERMVDMTKKVMNWKLSKELDGAQRLQKLCEAKGDNKNATYHKGVCAGIMLALSNVKNYNAIEKEFKNI